MDSAYSIKILRDKITQAELVADNMDMYERYIQQIETNKLSEPNVCFEAAKALSEAIFRHILAHEKIKGEFKEILNRANVSTGALYIQVCRALSDLKLLDIEIMNPGKQFFNDIGLIRNDTGMISHGRDLRALEDLRPATIELAIANVANHLLVLIGAYELMLEPSPLAYEDHQYFNDYLDNKYELEGVKYSRALYDQDQVLYEGLLDEYKLSDDREDV